jgi:uncharacterized protein (TIGR03067 family)
VLRYTLLLSAVACLAFAPAPFVEKNRQRRTSAQALQELQGTWERVEYRFGTREDSAPTAYGLIQGGSISFGRRKGDLGKRWCPLNIEPGRRPRSITIESPDMAPDKTLRGIYDLDGDRLTLCTRYSPREEDRPSQFTSEGPQHLEVWVRVRD